MEFIKWSRPSRSKIKKNKRISYIFIFVTHPPIDFMCILTIQLFWETNKLYKNEFNVCQELSMMMRRLFKGSSSKWQNRGTYKLKNFVYSIWTSPKCGKEDRQNSMDSIISLTLFCLASLFRFIEFIHVHLSNFFFFRFLDCIFCKIKFSILCV